MNRRRLIPGPLPPLPAIRYALSWGFVVAASGFACVTPGSEGTSATSTTTSGSATSNTDGMSSTSAASTSSTTEASTAVTTAADTSSTTASKTSGCNFLCQPDGGPAGTFECDPWEQKCPEGQKCNAWRPDGGGWNGTKCVPVDPDPDGVHEPCTVEGSGVSGIDSCVKGAMCWNVDPRTQVGFCVPLCKGSEEQCTSDPESCCPQGSTCQIPSGGALILCIEDCNPLLQDCAGPGAVCYPVSAEFHCDVDASGDMGAVGAPCEYINTCDPGTFCGNPAAYPGCDMNASGCCIPFCSLMSPDCVMGTVCQPWYDPMDVPPGYEDLGACVIP